MVHRYLIPDRRCKPEANSKTPKGVYSPWPCQHDWKILHPKNGSTLIYYLGKMFYCLNGKTFSIRCQGTLNKRENASGRLGVTYDPKILLPPKSER
jgi:hypothetical protein